MKNPFKWASDHIKKLFGHTAEPVTRKIFGKKGKFKPNPTIPHGALYQFLAMLDFGAQERKRLKLTESQREKERYRELTESPALLYPKNGSRRQRTDLQKIEQAVSDHHEQKNHGRLAHRKLVSSPTKIRKRLRQQARGVMLHLPIDTHAALSRAGIPRRKDGNKLGLKQRRQLSFERGIHFPPSMMGDGAMPAASTTGE